MKNRRCRRRRRGRPENSRTRVSWMNFASEISPYKTIYLRWFASALEDASREFPDTHAEYYADIYR